MIDRSGRVSDDTFIGRVIGWGFDCWWSDVPFGFGWGLNLRLVIDVVFESFENRFSWNMIYKQLVVTPIYGRD